MKYEMSNELWDLYIELGMLHNDDMNESFNQLILENKDKVKHPMFLELFSFRLNQGKYAEYIEKNEEVCRLFYDMMAADEDLLLNIDSVITVTRLMHFNVRMKTHLSKGEN